MSDLVRVRLVDGTEVTVGSGFAETKRLEILDKPSTHNGRSLRAKFPVDLRGKELDTALSAAGLPKTGSAGEKRARLAHQTSAEQFGGEGSTNPVGESDTSEEDSK